MIDTSANVLPFGWTCHQRTPRWLACSVLYVIEMFVGAYRVECLIGTGGMGSVYRARHALSGRVVAVKVQHLEQLAVRRTSERMMREASILAQLLHPGVPRFFECGVLDDDRRWIAMDLVEGLSLARQLVVGPLEPEVVTALVATVAEVLGSAHEVGITHRDLKPDNIFLTPNDDRCAVRVIDWGIAHHQGGVRFTNHDDAIGTPIYMSPEQARGGPAGGHCDIYALGVIAYHALAGQAPFAGTNGVELLLQHLHRPPPPLAPRCPEAPIGLVELVERMMAKSYGERPTAREVHAALREQRRETPAYVRYSLDDGVVSDTIEMPTKRMRI